PARSIHVSQCRRIASAFSRCRWPQRPPVTWISLVPSGRQTEDDGWTGPPGLADGIKHFGFVADKDRDAVRRQGYPGGGSPVVPLPRRRAGPGGAGGQADIAGPGARLKDRGDEQVGAEHELVVDVPGARVSGKVDEQRPHRGKPGP